MVLTRPKITFTVHKLSQYVAAPTLQHVMAYKRILRYLKGIKDYGLKFSTRVKWSLHAILLQIGPVILMIGNQ